MHQKNHARASLYCASALHGMIHTLSLFLSPLNVEIAAYFQTHSVATVTSFKTAYLIVYSASNLFFGVWTHRLPVRQTLSFGMLANSVAVTLFYFVPPDGISFMYILWTLAAVGGGVYHPVANVFITRKFSERKGWALGITGIGSGIGFAFGPLITGALSRLGLDWQLIALLFGLTGTLAGGIAYLIIRDDGKDEGVHLERGNPNKLPQGLTWPLLGFLAWMILLTASREVSMWSILDVSAFFLEVSTGNASLASWHLFIMYLPGIVTQPFIGTWSDRWGRRGFALLTFSVFGVALALLPFLSPSWYLLSYFLMGAAQSASVPLVEAMIADHTTPENRGMMFGIFITAIMGLGAVGPYLSGAWLDGVGRTLDSFRLLFSVLGGTVVFSGICLYFTPYVSNALKLKKG
ncbi:MAG: MFS transporter [Spirochaetes bacterium]|nr:MFS transporter [Spirochaetota bacterium]